MGIKYLPREVILKMKGCGPSELVYLSAASGTRRGRDTRAFLHWMPKDWPRMPCLTDEVEADAML